MSVVFACIAPHGGHLISAPSGHDAVPKSRAAMARMRVAFDAARPEAVAVITPHGVYADAVITIGAAERGSGKLETLTVEAKTHMDLVSSWSYHADDMDVPVVPVAPPGGAPFPLDWGVTIPLAILDPGGALPIAVACPSREVKRSCLMDWGEALGRAADELDLRVALIVSADQGHGHAKDGPYGYTAASAAYDKAMRDAVQADDLERLLTWDDQWIESGLPDSYWQTLSLIGLRRRVNLKSTFLSYEVDHYFGLLCAMYESA